MKTALHLYRNQAGGLNEVCRRFNISKSTFLRHLRGTNKFSKENIKGSGGRPVFPPELEAELVKYILQLERVLFGITKKDLLRLAFQLADRNGLSSNFNADTKSAGRYWFENFLRRNPEISLRTPEATSIARASGFSRPNVEQFFNILQEAVEQKKYD
ncbi:hypothetical protein SNE40_000044 [Patella caerulea]|uniref:HTH CENPB-type domain-containing protein n=1 Tax=Patella caerulea TaxID=87958 RepID=A0AAN8KDJ9_PATCE